MQQSTGSCCSMRVLSACWSGRSHQSAGKGNMRSCQFPCSRLSAIGQHTQVLADVYGMQAVHGTCYCMQLTRLLRRSHKCEHLLLMLQVPACSAKGLTVLPTSTKVNAQVSTMQLPHLAACSTACRPCTCQHTSASSDPHRMGWCRRQQAAHTVMPCACLVGPDSACICLAAQHA